MSKTFIEQLNINLPTGWEGQAHTLARMVSNHIRPGSRSIKTVHIPALQIHPSASLPEVAQHIADAINQQLSGNIKSNNRSNHD